MATKCRGPITSAPVAPPRGGMHHGGESQEKTRSSKAAPKTAASAVQVADVAPTASAAKWRVTEHRNAAQQRKFKTEFEGRFRSMCRSLNVPTATINNVIGSEAWGEITGQVAAAGKAPNQRSHGTALAPDGEVLISSKERNHAAKWTDQYFIEEDGKKVALKYAVSKKTTKGLQTAIGCPACIAKKAKGTPYRFVIKPAVLMKVVNSYPNNRVQSITPKMILDASIWIEREGGTGKIFTIPIADFQSLGPTVYAHYTRNHPQSNMPLVTERFNDLAHRKELKAMAACAAEAARCLMSNPRSDTEEDCAKEDADEDDAEEEAEEMSGESADDE